MSVLYFAFWCPDDVAAQAKGGGWDFLAASPSLEEAKQVVADEALKQSSPDITFEWAWAHLAEFDASKNTMSVIAKTFIDGDAPLDLHWQDL